jgi:hypothetical protein
MKQEYSKHTYKAYKIRIKVKVKLLQNQNAMAAGDGGAVLSKLVISNNGLWWSSGKDEGTKRGGGLQ